MDPDAGPPIPADLHRRLQRLAVGPAIPADVDRAIIERASAGMAQSAAARIGWRAVAAAAIVGITAGVAVTAAIARHPRPLDMVDALQASRRGAPESQVRQIEAAAVALRTQRSAKGGGS